MTQLDRFARSLLAWMNGRGYQVGLTGRKVDCPRLLQWVKEELPGLDTTLHLVGPHGTVAASVLNLLIGTMTGGASAEEVAARLHPFGPYVDLIGLRIDSDIATLLPVLFADDVPTGDLSVYVETYAGFAAGLKDIVMRGLLATPRVDCSALFVYFDPDRLADAMSDATGLYHDKRMVRVRGTFVDVAGRVVTGAVANSVLGSIRQAIGTDDGEFNSTALRAILLEPRNTQLSLE